MGVDVPDRGRQRVRGLAGLRQRVLARPLLRRRRRDGSGITTSARRTTSARSGSSSSCSPRREATTSTSDLVSVEPDGVYLAADWAHAASRRRPTSATPGPPASPRRAASSPTAAGSTREPARLALNQWALSGDWTVGEQITTLNEPGGRIAYRFHGARPQPRAGLADRRRAGALPGAGRRDAAGPRPRARRRRAGRRDRHRGAALPADPPGRPDHRPHLRDHLPRRRAPRPTCSPSARTSNPRS